jgi:arginase
MQAARLAPHAKPSYPLIAVPTSAGFPDAPGLRLGPARILAELEPSWSEVRWPRLGDLSLPAVTAAVAPGTAAAVGPGAVPLVVGGDHSVALGAVQGVRAGLRRWARRTGRTPPLPADQEAAPGDVPLFLLWLDAHPDVNTPATSPTGRAHGMVLAALLGAGPLAAPEPIPASRVVLAGARAFDPGERQFLRARPELDVWDVELLRDHRWQAPLDDLLRRVSGAGGRLYVSLDLDVLDPADAPGVAVPEGHGALPAPLLALLRRVRASGLLAGADVVEYYPPADKERQTSRLAASGQAAHGAARPQWDDGPPGMSVAYGSPAMEGPGEAVRAGEAAETPPPLLPAVPVA